MFKAKTSWLDEQFIPNLSLLGNNKNDTLEKFKCVIDVNIKHFATKYTQSLSQHEDYINCPDLKLELPIDSFYCKHNDLPCPIQGQISKTNKEKFFKACNIDNRKEGIWNAISQGKYQGFHHMPGKYLCPSCEERNSKKNIYKNYYYPWELCLISESLNLDYDELKRKIREKKLNGNVLFSSFCTSCSIEILSKLEYNKDFEIYETEFYR